MPEIFVTSNNDTAYRELAAWGQDLRNKLEAHNFDAGRGNKMAVPRVVTSEHARDLRDEVSSYNAAVRRLIESSPTPPKREGTEAIPWSPIFTPRVDDRPPVLGLTVIDGGNGMLPEWAGNCSVNTNALHLLASKGVPLSSISVGSDKVSKWTALKGYYAGSTSSKTSGDRRLIVNGTIDPAVGFLEVSTSAGESYRIPDNHSSVSRRYTGWARLSFKERLPEGGLQEHVLVDWGGSSAWTSGSLAELLQLADFAVDSPARRAAEEKAKLLADKPIISPSEASWIEKWGGGFGLPKSSSFPNDISSKGQLDMCREQDCQLLIRNLTVRTTESNDKVHGGVTKVSLAEVVNFLKTREVKAPVRFECTTTKDGDLVPLASLDHVPVASLALKSYSQRPLGEKDLSVLEAMPQLESIGLMFFEMTAQSVGDLLQRLPGIREINLDNYGARPLSDGDLRTLSRKHPEVTFKDSAWPDGAPRRFYRCVQAGVEKQW